MSYTDYILVAPRKLKKYADGVCARIGSTLRFARPFTADSPQLGGTLQLPVYLKAIHLVDATDEVPVDDPNWLVTRTAAEYVRNDVTRQQQFEALMSEANNLLALMRDKLDEQYEEINMPWTAG